MIGQDASNPAPLPEPGPPFRIGDEIAFLPAEIDSPDDPGWLGWDFAVIDDVNEASESISFHFVGTPDARHAQGMENIVRRSPSYAAWRSAYTAALAASPASVAHGETSELWLRVLAEHPIHGGSRFPHPAVAARRAAASGQTGDIAAP